MAIAGGHSEHSPLHVQSWRVAGSKVGKPTQTRPRPQTCLDVPQAALVQGPANWAVTATAKVRMVVMTEVCILGVVERVDDTADQCYCGRACWSVIVWMNSGMTEGYVTEDQTLASFWDNHTLYQLSMNWFG